MDILQILSILKAVSIITAILTIPPAAAALAIHRKHPIKELIAIANTPVIEEPPKRRYIVPKLSEAYTQQYNTLYQPPPDLPNTGWVGSYWKEENL